jgi:hypothetical protein
MRPLGAECLTTGRNKAGGSGRWRQGATERADAEMMEPWPGTLRREKPSGAGLTGTGSARQRSRKESWRTAQIDHGLARRGGHQSVHVRAGLRATCSALKVGSDAIGRLRAELRAALSSRLAGVD